MVPCSGLALLAGASHGSPLTHAGPSDGLCCGLQVKGLSNTFAEAEGSPLSWRTDMRYSGLNIGVMGIFYEPLQRCCPLPLQVC